MPLHRWVGKRAMNGAIPASWRARSGTQLRASTLCGDRRSARITVYEESRSSSGRPDDDGSHLRASCGASQRPG